jgi:hypothetical protein
MARQYHSIEALWAAINCAAIMQFVLRCDPDKRRDRGTHLPVTGVRVRVLGPVRLRRLIGEHVVPKIRI